MIETMANQNYSLTCQNLATHEYVWKQKTEKIIRVSNKGEKAFIKICEIHPRPTGQNLRNIEIIEERLRTRENLCKSVKSVGLK